MSTHRNFGLDLARALAITGVFLAHGVTFFEQFGVGVDLFFVLSGFLIGRIYLRAQGAGKYPLWSFWQARWFRTLPPYLVALGLFALVDMRFHSTPVRWYYLLFWQNYLGVEGFGPSWSLCVEEHFYLALPLLGFLILRTTGRRSLLWALPLLAAVPQVLRAIAYFSGTLPAQWYWRSHLRSEGLILGVWLAYLFLDRVEVWKRLRRPALVLAVLPVLALGYACRVANPSDFFRMTDSLMYAVGFAAWVRLFYDLRWSPVHVFGRVVKESVHGVALAAYSIYLVHTLVFTDLRVVLDGWARGPGKSATILVAAMLASAAFYFLVEKPTIGLRDWYLKRG